jgi:hypothetical protein
MAGVDRLLLPDCFSLSVPHICPVKSWCIPRSKNKNKYRRRFLVLGYTANEGPVRIQYKCLVPIYVFPEMKLHGLVIYKTEL